MIPVASLLNPLPPSIKSSHKPQALPRSRVSSSDSAFSTRKKLKMSKGATLPVKAKPNGKVRYSPCDLRNDVVKAEHLKFHMEPVSSIKDYPRRIPYNSDKKTFQERTGRDAFEAFQYTFRMPEDPVDKEPHVVMWDYNIGLVRITSFFKSLKHPKTMPAKVMTSNPGLKEISHSITGGSISAQGYWVPYEAARAIAAKFCWEIRYVLTPVFGIDFPASCVEPEDPAFLKLGIDKSIIHHCNDLANKFRASNQDILTITTSQNLIQGSVKSLLPKPLAKQDYESGYGTDTDRSLSNSPHSGTNDWTPVNGHTAGNPYQTPVSHSTKILDGNPWGKTPMKEAHEGGKQRKRRRPSEDPCMKKGDEFKIPFERPNKRVKQLTKVEEARAAYALVQLYSADASFADRQRLIGRRASC